MFALANLAAYSGWFVCSGVVGVFTLASLVFGFVLMKRQSKWTRRMGRLLLVFSVAVSVLSALAPFIWHQAVVGRPPLHSPPADGVIRAGMSADEVREILGEPHRTGWYGHFKQWSYHLDHFDTRHFVLIFAPGDVVQAAWESDD